jgi:hypothetical protein
VSVLLWEKKIVKKFSCVKKGKNTKNHLIINYLIVAHYYYKVCIVTFEKCVIHGIVLVIFEAHIDPMYPFSNTHHRRPLQKLKFNLHIITVKPILI